MGEAERATSAALRKGDRIAGRYVIESLIDEGGMGTVFSRTP
jgi:hypothetical protein